MNKKDVVALLVYVGLALGVFLPLLAPGFILTLDMVFVPQLPWPSEVRSSFLFHALLHVLNFVIPADVLQKTVLFSLLVMAGIGAHRLFESLELDKKYWLYGAYFAGIFYMLNPFVYARFMAGQYAVLLGYALLPFFVRALLELLKTPNLRSAAVVALWALAISIVSIHGIGLMVVVAGVAAFAAAYRYRRAKAHLGRIAKYAFLSVVIFLVASSYWLVPLLQGSGSVAETIRGFDQADREAFATLGGNWFGALANVVRLQGFWAEGRDLFLLPQQIVPAWGLAGLAILALVVAGAVALFKRQKYLGLVFVASTIFALLLAIGVGQQWLGTLVPLFAGYREPHKFAGLVALGFAILAGVGVVAVLGKIAKRWPKNETIFGAATGVLLTLPIIFMPIMFWGFIGQLSPRQYPADWTQTNQQLNADKSDFRVLFLPWHQYMGFEFTGRIIENPAKKFFQKPMVVSNDPEYAGLSPTVEDGFVSYIGKEVLPNAPDRQDLGQRLADLGIKYVLLAKDYDFETYSYLDNQPDLKLLSDTKTLKFYEVRAGGGQ